MKLNFCNPKLYIYLIWSITYHQLFPTTPFPPRIGFGGILAWNGAVGANWRYRHPDTTWGPRGLFTCIRFYLANSTPTTPTPSEWAGAHPSDSSYFATFVWISISATRRKSTWALEEGSRGAPGGPGMRERLLSWHGLLFVAGHFDPPKNTNFNFVSQAKPNK